jgi:hypothetical protein
MGCDPVASPTGLTVKVDVQGRKGQAAAVPNVIEISDPYDSRTAVYRDIRERDLVGRAGLFIAEGKVVVEKLIGSDIHQPMSLLIADKRVEALRPMISRLADDVPVYAATQSVIDAIAGFPLHRGILAVGHRVFLVCSGFHSVRGGFCRSANRIGLIFRCVFLLAVAGGEAKAQSSNGRGERYFRESHVFPLQTCPDHLRSD